MPGDRRATRRAAAGRDAGNRILVGRVKAAEERFERLLDELVQQYDIEDRSALRETIEWAEDAYIGAQYWRKANFDERAPDSLDELEGPLRHVIHLLNREMNYYRLVGALASIRGTDGARESDRLYELMRELDTIRLITRTAHVNQKRGRPKAEELYLLVSDLAHYWTTTLKRELKRDWHDGEPLTEAMGFIAKVVKYVDPERLPSLPTVTKNVAATFRKKPIADE
jgi:hypothetical protein